MEVQKENFTIITLKLNAKEAGWLKELAESYFSKGYSKVPEFGKEDFVNNLLEKL